MKSHLIDVKQRAVSTSARLFSILCGIAVLVAVTGCDPRSLFNEKPIADAGEDISIILGSAATLDGSGSSDAEQDAISYQWALVSYPQGSTLRDSDIDGDENVRAYVTPDIIGTYDFTLTVSDDYGSSSDTVTVTVIDGTIYTGTLSATYDIYVMPEREYIVTNDTQLRFGIMPAKGEDPRSLRVPAIQFTMPADFDGKTVSSALLKLHVRYYSGTTLPPDISGNIIPIMVGWTDSSATFDASWVETEYENAVSFTVTSDDVGYDMTFDVAKLLQDWADGTITNNGLALYPVDPGDDISYYFDTNETTESDAAPPILEIAYY